MKGNRQTPSDASVGGESHTLVFHLLLHIMPSQSNSQTQLTIKHNKVMLRTQACNEGSTAEVVTPN